METERITLSQRERDRLKVLRAGGWPIHPHVTGEIPTTCLRPLRTYIDLATRR